MWGWLNQAPPPGLQEYQLRGKLMILIKDRFLVARLALAARKDQAACLRAPNPNCWVRGHPGLTRVG